MKSKFIFCFALLLICSCTKIISKSDLPLYYYIVLNTDEEASITNAPNVYIFVNGNMQ